MQKNICDICGQSRIRLIVLPDGRRICPTCQDMMENNGDEDQIKVKLPNDLVAFWVGSASRQGWASDGTRRRIFEVPDNQRPMIEFDKPYLIIIKEIKPKVKGRSD